MNSQNTSNPPIKIAMVVGGDQGMGLQAAKVLGQKGANVIIVGNNALTALKELAPFAPGRCDALQADWLESDGIAKIIEFIQQPSRVVDYLINATGPFTPQPVNDLSISDGSLNVAVNKAVFTITQAVVDDMMAAQGGNVVNLGWPPTGNSSGAETSGYFITKYVPGEKIPPHAHPKGEEILMLDGVYSDEDGDYKTGAYLRNPPGSAHVPFSIEGCVMFVRMDQFTTQDKQTKNIQISELEWKKGPQQIQFKALHEFADQQVLLIKYPADSNFHPWLHFRGGEIFTLPHNLLEDKEHVVMVCGQAVITTE